MFVANPNKRKSFGGQNGTPQSGKKPKQGRMSNGGTPQATPNKQKQNTPKTTPGSQNKNQAGKKPQNSPKTPVNVKKELVTPSPKTPKLKMFGGTGNLSITENDIKKEPLSVKQEPGSAKKGPGSAKKGPNSPAKGPGSPKKQPGSAKKNLDKAAAGKKVPLTETSATETTTNRHKRRREKRKHRREEAREKEKELRIRLSQGDAAAQREVQEKIKHLEGLAVKSKTSDRKLMFLQKLLSGDSSRPWLKTEKPEKKASAFVQKQQAAKQRELVKKEKQKQALLKTEPENDSDDSDDAEDDSSEDQATNENEASDEVASAEETSGDEEEASDDEEASEDGEEEEDEAENEESSEGEQGSEEESDDEGLQKNEVGNKNKLKQQIVNKNKANKQESKGPVPSLDDIVGKGKSSRYVVFVGNLPYSATKDDLTEHFKKIGAIVDIRIPTNQDNKPKGFAYVEVVDQECYQKALSLHHTFLGGRRINVMYTQGGKKKSENKKNEIKAKNFKLQAMRNQGQLIGSVKAGQKRSVRRAKKRQFEKE